MGKWGHKKLHYAWIILIGGIFLQSGSVGIIFNSVSLYLQPVSQAIGTRLGDLSLYITYMRFAAAAAMPLVGRWLPTKNINILLSVMVSVCALGYALEAFYTQVWQWYISSVIMGFSGGFLFFVPVPMILRNWFKKKTGFAIGLATAFSGITGAFATPLETAMMQALGWRETYFIMGMVALLLCLPFTLFVIKFKPSDVGLKAYGEDPSDTVDQAAADMGRGMSYKRAKKSGVMALIFVFVSLIALTGSYSQHLAGFSHYAGLGAIMAGYVYTAGMVGNMGSKLLLGVINDKAGVKTAFIVSSAMISLSLVLMLAYSGNPVSLYVAGGLFGFAMAAAVVMPPLLINKMVGGKNYPKIFSYSQIGNMVAAGLGVGIAGKLYDFTGSYTAPILLILTCTLINIPIVIYSLRCAKKVGFDMVTS